MTVDKVCLSIQNARQIGKVCVGAAGGDEGSVSISIVDMSGSPLFGERLNSASPRTMEVATLKAQVAMQGPVSKVGFENVEVSMRYGESAVQRIFTRAGLPIFSGLHVIGAIGVFGSDYELMDDEIAAAGIRAFDDLQKQGVEV